jgi:Uma2 family endonuclease
MCALPLEHEIEYPTSDGQPMAETTLHRKVMSDIIEGLEWRYADVADVWVGGNLFLYYEKGNRKKSVAPDVLLVRGVRKWARDCFFLWEEKTPELIFEITSRSTRNEDEGKNKDTYERLGVPELVLFDPYGEYLDPRLQGYRLQRGRYRRIRLNADGSLDLRTAGITVRPEGQGCAWWTPPHKRSFCGTTSSNRRCGRPRSELPRRRLRVRPPRSASGPSPRSWPACGTHPEPEDRAPPAAKTEPGRAEAFRARESLRGPSRGRSISCQRAFAPGIASRRAGKTLFDPLRDLWVRAKDLLGRVCDLF